MQSGVRRLGRKRFAEAVKYLKQVISDPTRSDKMRMQAVESLIAIFDRNDRTLTQYEQRRRAQEAATATAEPSEAPESQEESVDAFLARVKAERQKGTTE